MTLPTKSPQVGDMGLALFGIVSLLCLGLFALFQYGPFPHRDVLDVAQQEVPLHWYELVRILFSFSVIPAAIGAFSLLGTGRLQLLGRWWLLVAGTVGLAASSLGYLMLGASHLDCADQCVASTPTNPQVALLIGTMVLLWVALPLGLYFYGKRRT